MMNDDTLTLYYYNDGLSRDERQQLTEQLAADADLAARYRTLSAQLDGLGETDESAALAPDMAARFHDTVDRAARLERRTGRAAAMPVHGWSFFWGAAVTAALAVGIGIGVWIGGGETDPAPPQYANTTTGISPGAFERSMQVHFRDSQENLGQLDQASDADRMLLIMKLIEQNRLFEKAAEQNDSDDLARVLRAFEPVLVKLASEDITPEEALALREKLAFELNVMLTKLSYQTSEMSETT